MLELKIRPRAKRDLRDIWRYTHATWSREQADRYLAKLHGVIAELRKRPELGLPSNDISLGLFRRNAERHVIYFRTMEKRLIVVRVLHDRMDAAAQFANDKM